MTIKKLVTYNPVDLTGEKLNLIYELNLKVSENSGNYLIHKDILRHFTAEKKKDSFNKDKKRYTWWWL